MFVPRITNGGEGRTSLTIVTNAANVFTMGITAREAGTTYVADV